MPPDSAGQVVLDSSGVYTQSFATLSSGLPTGWGVYTGASTASSLGTAAAFTSTATAWSNTASVFRNISSNDISSTSLTAAQASNTNRALGIRPVDVTSGDPSARQSSLMFSIANTSGLQSFSVSLSLFTANDVSNNQTYQFEYRVGSTGNFTSLGTYTTGSTFAATTLTADSITLSALNNQSDGVYFRIRGTSTSGTGNLDTLGVDNFSMTYSVSAIPEPSTYAAIAGGLALVGAMWWRRR
jgi:hypothetical protein